MIDYRKFDVVYGDSGEPLIQSVILYGKADDAAIYRKPTMAEEDKIEMGDLMDILKVGAKVSYDGSIQTPLNFSDEGDHVSLTIGDGIVLNSKTAPPRFDLVSPGDEIDCFGKVASDLQSDIRVDGNRILGRLHYISNFTGFSGLEEEQNGYYLATHYIPHPNEADIYVYKTNGTVGVKKLSRPDLTMVSRITDKSKQKLQVYAEKEGLRSETVTFDLSGLILEPQTV